MHEKIKTAAALGATLALAGCGGSNGPTEPYALDFDPANFVTAVTNPFFPLTPGTTYRYRGETADGLETGIVEVTGDVRMIQGISATVVHDRVFLEGDLIEETFDWYAPGHAGATSGT